MPPVRDHPRRVLLITHSGRGSAVQVAHQLIDALGVAGITVLLPRDEYAELCAASRPPGAAVWQAGEPGVELVVVVGGDGTILRAAEYAVDLEVPLLGVNLGHVGFLAEVESDAVPDVVAAIVARTYRVDQRMALQVRVGGADGGDAWTSWALNEVSLEKSARQRMIDVVLEIDGHPLSRWGCDGVVIATPTGSTAYAWSVGGPVMWPQVAATVVAPISAHALFARPLVVAPHSVVALELGVDSPPALLTCDGRRTTTVAPGTRVEATAHPQPVQFARLHPDDFTDRLVAKFHLPVDGWRGQGPR